MVIEAPRLTEAEQEFGLGLESARIMTAAISDKIRRRGEYQYYKLDEIESAIVREIPEQYHSVVDISWDDSVGYSWDEWNGMIGQNFGGLARKFREKAGFTVEQLAEKSQFIDSKNSNAVCCVEGDIIVPKGEQLVDYMDILGIDVRGKTAHLLLLKSIQSPTTVTL